MVRENNLLCLTALLTLCVFAIGCGRRAPPRTPDPGPPTADFRATAPSVQQTPPPVTSVTSASLSTAVPTPTDMPPILSTTPALPSNALPSSVTAPGVPAPPVAMKETARQVSVLVRTADAAVRATPAGSQVWARVEAAQAAYDATLRLDDNYRGLLERKARLDSTGPTNAMDDPIAVGDALGAREDVLMRDQTDVAQARETCEQARREYGRLVRKDPRFTEAESMMGTMETNGVTPKTP